MLKVVVALAVVAGIMVLAVALTAPDGISGSAGAASALRAGSWVPDVRSFSAGIVIGLTVAWIKAFPWGDLPAIIMDYMRLWRRRLTLLGLGAIFAGVLMYY